MAHLRDRAARRRLGRAGGARQRFLGGAPRRCGDRRSQRDPAADHRRDPAPPHARLRVPRDPRARRADAARGRRAHRRPHERRQLLVGAPRRVARHRGDARDRGDRRGRRRQRVLLPRRPAHRAPDGDARPDGRAGDHLPGDRRPRASRAAPGDAGRQRAAHGPMARRGRIRAERVGDRPLLADRREPGWDPARLERRHSGVSVGREGDRHGDDLLGARRLRRARAAPRQRQGAASRRRREPRQPALRPGRRGDPHGQPDREGEAREPGLPSLLRQRLQRHARARAVRLGGAPRMDRRPPRKAPGRAAARASRGRLPVHAGRDVRRRSRPDRPVGAHRHDGRARRRVRDVLELRRGRPPLGPRARGYAGGTAQARPPVRSHRAGLPVRPAALRDRRPLRPRADPGRHVQAAERLRSRRARRSARSSRPT